MYEVFDSYLNVDTWHTSHDLDGGRFFRALHKALEGPNFNPDEMGEYMRRKKSVSRDDDDQFFNKVIDRRVEQAWAVKDYLETNRL